jgi:hypothetical protein
MNNLLDDIVDSFLLKIIITCSLLFLIIYNTSVIFDIIANGVY